MAITISSRCQIELARGRLLVVVLERCEGVDEEELTAKELAWMLAAARQRAGSARTHGRGPNWRGSDGRLARAVSHTDDLTWPDFWLRCIKPFFTEKRGVSTDVKPYPRRRRGRR